MSSFDVSIIIELVYIDTFDIHIKYKRYRNDLIRPYENLVTCISWILFALSQNVAVKQYLCKRENKYFLILYRNIIQKLITECKRIGIRYCIFYAWYTYEIY